LAESPSPRDWGEKSASEKPENRPLSNLNTGALRCTQCCQLGLQASRKLPVS